MKRYIYYIWCLLGLGLLTGCMFEEESIETKDENLVHMVFTAMVEDGSLATKTVLDENDVDGFRDVLWEPEDVIGVATYNGRYQRFENVLEEPAASGVFEGSVNQDIMYYAIYPYRDNQQMSTSVNVTIPSKQTYKPNSFDGSAAPMVGKGNHAEPLHFMNLCGSLAINITGTAKIKSIVFETKAGEKVSGDATVDPDYADYPILTMSETADTYIVLDCGEGVQLSGDPASFHFVLPPATYKGFKITIATVDGQFMEKSTDKQLNIKRSIVTKAASFAFENNVKDFTDLSERGNANSYIVSQSGNYSFDATVIGNGEFGFTPDHNFHTNSPEISPSYVDVLWEDSLGLIKVCGYDSTSGEAKLITSGKEGNAVLAAMDADGTIIWSWHIWMTDQPEEQIYNNNAGTLMDRNLGAVSATPGDVGALGLLYQWGRKDPFLGASSINSNEVRKSTITWPSTVSSDATSGTIEYTVLNPTTFIKNNGSNYDWYYTGSSSTDNTRWQSEKTIYDPCPVGWRVPDGGDNGVWSISKGSSSDYTRSYDKTNKGVNFSGDFGSYPSIWYPSSGSRRSRDGALSSVGNYGDYWSITPSGREAYYLQLTDNGYIGPMYSGQRANGFSVRCTKDEGYVDISYPQVSITGFEQISTTSESLKANVKAEGISSVTERGFIYGQMPDLSDGIKVQCGSGLGEFLYTLTGLTKATKYYVAAYAINSRGEIHSPIKSFTTKFSDVVVDLSSNETANCYVVHELGIYSFDCTVKGNSLESVGSPVSVDVLWEIDKTNESTIVGDIICDVTLSQDNSIVFNATGKEGNALIAVKDIEGNILWSWHIWSTDVPDDQTYCHTSLGEYTIQDRNLGATRADVGIGDEWKESVGTLYQWGRKDPLVVGIYKGNSSIRTVEESILHPVEHASLGSWNYQSHWEKNHNNDLWSPEQKTIYDPCPAGYMVADNYTYYALSAEIDASNNGYYMFLNNSTTSWFPITPIIWCGGDYIEASNEVIVWTSRKTNNNSFHRLHIKAESDNYWDGHDNAAMASPVRCMKEGTNGGPKYETDFSISGAENLSDAGIANSYIVSSEGTYCFYPVKGNSTETVDAVQSVEVLWESLGTDQETLIGAVIKGVRYENSTIYFKTNDVYKEGNAVIAAKDANGTILWSWHIWLTDQPEEQIYPNNAGTMMDRNLGATSATPGDVGTLGLLYQWGRKDPFLGSSSISGIIEAKSTITWPSPVSSDFSNGTIEYAISHPTTFINYYYSNRDWYYTGSDITDDTRWQSEKTIYDPCPAGWRVPDGGGHGVWATAKGSSSDYNSSYDSTNEGINFSGDFGSASIIWYPASGCRIGDGGALRNVGDHGNYWSVTPDGRYAYSLCFYSSGDVDPTAIGGIRANGKSVRCLQESE